MKSGRQTEILQIISERDIETQHQLLQALAERGIKSTQATLSRDIKDMRLVKELGPNGNYRYAAARAESDNYEERLKKIFRESVLSYDVAQNLFIIRTLPGLANGACSAVDSMDIAYVVGTIAGDDTALIVMRETEYAREFCEELRGIINRTR